MFKELIEKLKAHPRTIVFTEGTDPRILEASARLLSGTFLTPILVGNEEAVKTAAENCGFNIRGAQIIDPATYPRMDEMVATMVELRKGKMTPEQCREALQKGNYFGTMLVKTKPGNKIVSSCMILVRTNATGGSEVIAMGDCAINIDPTADELVEIATECAHCARAFGIEPKVAMLSYSTHGSGKGPTVDKMREATEKVKATNPDFDIDGEMQFDAAVSPVVGQLKFPGSPVAGYANTFIFPEINSGNIGHKIAQRLGHFDAYGPVLLGLNAPINDLSRGCNAAEVYSMSIITASLCKD